MKSLLLLLLSLVVGQCLAQYKPTWDSLDTRPLPSWYDEAKIGIFIHWGVFSVPSYKSEWFWWMWQGYRADGDVIQFMNDNYPPYFTYSEFAPSFTAEFFQPDQWAELFQDSGAKYVVLTSKHHEGYTLWPSATSWNWNSADVGPKRDLVGDLAQSIRKKTDLRFGVYHSLMDWFHPLYLQDKSKLFINSSFPEAKTLPELYDLVNKYEPEVIWSDGDWEAPADYWKSKEFLSWLYNESPVKESVVVNDRWGLLTACHHGGFYTCNDRYNPGKLIEHKWENCMTIDQKSWGYRREANLEDYLSIDDLIQTLASTVSCGGNMLMNIGPTKEGTINVVFQERLRQMGKWLKVNGEAIYATKPWKFQNDTQTHDIWYTSSNNGGKTVYAIVLKWPKSGTLELGAPAASKETTVSMLGWKGEIRWKSNSKNITGISVVFPTFNPPELLQWAWVLKLENLS
ncbi:hypothetical protein CHUAL_000657 [Chamberlinius hualienensis]